MLIDLTKPFKMGRLTHRGLAKPGDPMFSDGPIIAGIPLTEWLGVSPKKTGDPTNSDWSNSTKDSPEE
jgi:hypothetical protein